MRLSVLNKTAAIIIAAYNCPDYIMDCVNSVKRQFPIGGWNYDLRIGVDGCQKTADVLLKNNIPFYWSAENYGAYLIRNSLMYLKPADAYCYFDSDDKMMPTYLNHSLCYITGGQDIVMTAKINTDARLKPIQGSRIENGGAMTFTHKALEAVGGFYRWRVAGDTDLMRRFEMAGFKIFNIREPLYYRRRHSESLTKKADTGMGSPYRKQAWQAMCAEREKGIIKIKPTIIKLEKK